MAKASLVAILYTGWLPPANKNLPVLPGSYCDNEDEGGDFIQSNFA